MTLPDFDSCYRALAARDGRFDGRLFVAITTTGIYCRPVCPARTARREHCRFFASAAAAQAAGFRPCLRCRPEVSPDAAAWNGTSSTVSRALSLINSGRFDGEARVGALAERLGIGERQLRRLFEKHLGASPVAVAQTRRILFAKQLIQETALSMTAIAGAAGFGSVRRFNDAFRRLYGASPTTLRSGAVAKPAMARGRGLDGQVITVRLAYRPPYDWDAVIAFLKGRAVDGVEWVEQDCYRRTIAIGPHLGAVAVTPGKGCLHAAIRLSDVSPLLAVVTRLRALFDLDADTGAIEAHLASDLALAPLVARRPGLRMPGSWDGFELAVRALLGQQVSVTAAQRLASRLVAMVSPLLPPVLTGDERLCRVFPDAAALAGADLSALGMPGARRAALKGLAEAVVADPSLMHPRGAMGEAVERLLALRGFGPWTVQYWAMRALRDSDAFPAGDVALLRVLATGDNPMTHADLAARAEAWRPWRGYAAQHLWAEDAARKLAL